MQGEIWVKSQVGEGATFSFKVPLKTAIDRDALELIQLPQSDAEKDILLIDSNEKSLQITLERLQFWRCSV